VFNVGQYGAQTIHLLINDSGCREVFIRGIQVGALYKYAVYSRYNNYVAEKSDPYGFAAELRPKTASIVTDIHQHQWQDEAWMQDRTQRQQLSSPISIYEVHPGSWRRVIEESGENRVMTYRELAHALAPYVKE